MNRKQYETKRKELMNLCESLINEGKTEEAQAKMKEVEALDNQWDAIAQAQASFNALNQEPQMVNAFGQAQGSFGFEQTGGNFYDSIEYRTAFMNHVLDGTPIRMKNENANTTTIDINSVIAPVIVERIIEQVEATGMILPLVTRTSYPAGVSIPVNNVRPIATWVAEGQSSDRQKYGAAGQVTLTGFKLRCAVSISLEAHTRSLPFFEKMFVDVISTAMVKAMEQSFISGDGALQPDGVLSNLDLPMTKYAGEIVIEEKKDPTLKTLLDAESLLPLAYENTAVWNMTKKTFMAFLGMVDNNGQPIARVNYGIDGKPERMLLGRKVILNEYMPSLGTVDGEKSIVAFLFDWKDYIFNSNYNMTVKAYDDNDTEDRITKAVMVCDGKPLTRQSLVTVAKKYTV